MLNRVCERERKRKGREGRIIKEKLIREGAREGRCGKRKGHI